MRGIAASALLLTLAGPAEAADPALTLPPRLIMGGMICDSIEDVVALIDQIVQAEPQVPASCGRLMSPVPAVVHILGPYEAGWRRYLLARYEIAMPSPEGEIPWVQFGWWGLPREIGRPL